MTDHHQIPKPREDAPPTKPTRGVEESSAADDEAHPQTNSFAGDASEPPGAASELDLTDQQR